MFHQSSGSYDSPEIDHCFVRTNQGTRTPFWWAGVTYQNSPNASLDNDLGSNQTSWGKSSANYGLEPIDVTSLATSVHNQPFIDPDSVRPRRYLLNTMNERPPDPKCIFSRANSSELEFDYGAAISAKCETMSFHGENDSIFDVTGISLNTNLKGDLLQQTLVKNMRTQHEKPVKKCLKKSSSMDEMKVSSGLQLLKEHLGTNQEYYENLRRCYELEGSGSLFPLEPTRSTDLQTNNPISHCSRDSSNLGLLTHSLSLETRPQRRISLAKQLTEQAQSKPPRGLEFHVNHPMQLRRAFSEQNLTEEPSSAQDNSDEGDDSDEAMRELHTISSFPVRGPKSLRKMKKVLKKVLAFEKVLTQLRIKLLNERVEDKTDLVQKQAEEPSDRWSYKCPLKDPFANKITPQPTAEDHKPDQTKPNKPEAIELPKISPPSNQKRPPFNQYLPRIIRNFSPVSRCLHQSLFQYQLEKRLEEGLKSLADQSAFSSDEDEPENEDEQSYYCKPTISPSLDSRCPSGVASPSLAYRNLLNGMDERFFRRIDTSTCLVVPPEYRIPTSQESPDQINLDSQEPPILGNSPLPY